MEGIRVNREPVGSLIAFRELFDGFEDLEVVRRIFGDEAEEVLRGLMVELHDRRGYMWINDRDGRLCISREYLRSGDVRYIYLDVVHELVHIKQLREGKQLFDRGRPYVDRPTEIEAYKYAVEEARRIGMSDDEILNYLRVDWISEEEVMRLAKHLGINLG